MEIILLLTSDTLEVAPLSKKNFMVQLAILSTSGLIFEVLKAVIVDDAILYDADELII
jgi:hypothetical protein